MSTSKNFHHRKSEFSSEADVSNTVFHRKSVTSDLNTANGSLTSNGKMQRKSILNLHEQPSSTTTHGGERQSYSSIHRQNRDSEVNTTFTSERRTCNVHKENREHNVKNSSSMSRIISGGGTGTESRSNVERSRVTRTQVSGAGIDFPSQSHSHVGSHATRHRGSQHVSSLGGGIDFPSYSAHGQHERVVTRRGNQSSISLGNDKFTSSSLYKSEYITAPKTTCAVHKINQGAFQHTRSTQEHKFFKTSN
ncbi:hypothetical protein M5D96_010166 [Drosophila gunungcola]|uniref:Uncharacterized protein n=2 Tax=Drosophila gunungcola TaxID=103775 RepID=A0A9P9YHD6_9MUSC|nr:hypothetical protein M5D96_010166 [Drosophila gunungcola]